MQRVQRTLSLRDKALLQLRKAIVIGRLEPGSLHSEQTIAARLGLSRTPIREALLQLAGEGLIVFLPNRGARIVDLDAAHLAQVLQFRAAIEGCGASRMAANPNPKRIAKLEAELKRQRAILRSGERLQWVDANTDFHTLLAEASENRLMIEAFGPLASHTKRLGYRMNHRTQRMQESLDEHSAIVDAIRRGDVDRARTMAEEHLYVTTVLMKQLFTDMGIGKKEEAGGSGLKKKRGRNAKSE
ncbi:MAG TPA: GntR family transcriptional regulator [Pseudolabrys sp.]|nr:GntR family transcriptional regulator [Pseudolabrys sp.]